MMKVINRLEQALKFWEALCFLNGTKLLANRALGVGEHREKPTGPFKHWPKFRSYLLNDHGEIFDSRRFMPPSRLANYCGGHLAILPMFLSAWTRGSRRIFHIGEELHALLNATSIGEITWDDVSFPFSSFALTLETPIVSKTGIKFDCVLMYLIGTKSKQGGEEEGIFLSIMLLDQAFENALAISRADVAKIQRWIKQKKWSRVSEAVESFRGDLERAPISHCFFLKEEDFGRAIQESLKKATHRGEEEHLNKAAHLICAFCAYLASLDPRDSVHQQEWTPVRRNKRDPRAITNGAHVCSVSSFHVLKSEERGYASATGTRSPHEVCAHFRRGHFRRRPGQGRDPDAPKIVWVRPTLVRRDRLEPGSVPGGTESMLE